MLLLLIRTPLLHSGDDLATILAGACALEPGDIVVVSSKAVATVEGAIHDLREVKPSAAADQWSKHIGRSPAFCELVLREMQRMHGRVVGSCPGALLTELEPEGLTRGTILTANAGLDESNAPLDHAIGWPLDPVQSVVKLRERLRKIGNVSSESFSPTVVLTDSCCWPRRLGVTAFALTVAGIDPLAPQAGKTDLFGRALRITTEAVADQLAAAANMLMGNAAQSTPAVVVRGHGILFSAFAGWVPGIKGPEDLFCLTEMDSRPQCACFPPHP